MMVCPSCSTCTTRPRGLCWWPATAAAARPLSSSPWPRRAAPGSWRYPVWRADPLPGGMERPGSPASLPGDLAGLAPLRPGLPVPTCQLGRSASRNPPGGSAARGRVRPDGRQRLPVPPGFTLVVNVWPGTSCLAGCKRQSRPAAIACSPGWSISIAVSLAR